MVLLLHGACALDLEMRLRHWRWSFLCPTAGRIQSKTTLWKFISYAANNYSCPDQSRKSFPRRVKLANNSTYKGESTWERASGNAGVNPEPELLVLSEPPATSVWTSQSQLKAHGWKQFNLICKPAETLAAKTANPDGAVLLLPGVTATAIKIQEKKIHKTEAIRIPHIRRWWTVPLNLETSKAGLWWREKTQLSVQRPTEPLTLMHSECPSDRSLLARESSTHEPWNPEGA